MIDLRSLFRNTVKCGRRTVYVTTTGSDTTGNGTIGNPYRQISKAVNIGTAQPGDLILVAGGTYDDFFFFDIGNTVYDWLGVMSLNDVVRPIIQQSHSARTSIVDFQTKFTGLYGFEVKDPAYTAHIPSYGLGAAADTADPNQQESCFDVHMADHHIVIWNTWMHDVPGAGIQCDDYQGGPDMLDFSYNVIWNLARYSHLNMSGISLFGLQEQTHGTTWDGVYSVRCIGNYIYDVVCLVPFTYGGFTDVTDGNGIIADSLFSQHNYTKKVLVEGNIAVGCGGHGFHNYNSKNVDWLGNTSAGNLRTNSPYLNGNAEIDGIGSADASNRVEGNVILPRNNGAIWNDGVSTYTRNVILGSAQAVSGTNIDHRAIGLPYFTGNPSQADLATGLQVVQFIPVTADRITKPSGAYGFQVQAVSVRPRGQWAAGAIEPTARKKYLR